MPIRRFTLDGRAIHSLDELYDLLSILMDFPGHFGRNLDALWDILSTEMEGPFEIIWRYADDSKKAMPEDFDRTVALLQELQEERGDFKLQIEP